MLNILINQSTLMSQSRVARLASAQTPDQSSGAQHMGLFDKIKDWLRGGEKKEAIKLAFDLLRAPAGDPSAHGAQREHGDLLQHFNILQNAMRPEYIDRCKLTVQRDDLEDTWSYQMEVDGKMLVSSSNLPTQTGHLLTAFQDHAMLAQLGSHLHNAFGADSVEQRQVLLEKFSEINAVHEDLTFSKVGSALLEKFCLLSANLEKLGAPAKGCDPAVKLFAFQGELAASLSIGEHCVGSFIMRHENLLNETLATLGKVHCSAIDAVLQGRDVNEALLTADGSEILHMTTAVRSNLSEARHLCHQNPMGARQLGLYRPFLVDHCFDAVEKDEFARMKVGKTDLAQLWSIVDNASNRLNYQYPNGNASAAAAGDVAAPSHALPSAAEMAVLVSQKA